jgi:hypothetical protein
VPAVCKILTVFGFLASLLKIKQIIPGANTHTKKTITNGSITLMWPINKNIFPLHFLSTAAPAFPVVEPDFVLVVGRRCCAALLA